MTLSVKFQSQSIIYNPYDRTPPFVLCELRRNAPIKTHPDHKVWLQICLVLYFCLLLNPAALNSAVAESGEILIEDFEDHTLEDWEFTGTAFGTGTAKSTLPGQRPVTAFRDKGFVNSHHGGEKGTGIITSPPFTIERNNINFKISGGYHPHPLDTEDPGSHGDSDLVHIGLGSYKHVVFDDIVVERDRPGSSKPEVLFRENYDAMGQSGGMYGLDPDVWNVGADDGDAVPWPPPSKTVQPGACYSRLWDLGNGDWCFFDRNGDFKGRRLMTGIRSVRGFPRGNNLRITFKTWGRTDMGGEPYPLAAGFHGPWHSENQFVTRITDFVTRTSLEQDMVAGLMYWPAWKHEWWERRGRMVQSYPVGKNSPYFDAALKAFNPADPTDLTSGKAHALTIRVWLGDDSGGKLEFSGDDGRTWNSLTDAFGFPVKGRPPREDGMEWDVCSIDLLVDDEVVRTASGANWAAEDDGHLGWYTWDVKDLKGKTARIRIVDTHDGSTRDIFHLYDMLGQGAGGGFAQSDPLPWGYLNIDHIVQSDRRRLPVYANPWAELAMRSVDSLVRRGIGNVKDRLSFHFRPPAHGNGDPCGLINHNGYYHMFYSYNPDAYGYGYKHWGHARTKDMVHWEYLPMGLCPSREIGEKHIYTGNAVINDDGVPMIFYASIGMQYGSAIGAAVPMDDKLIGWEKHPAIPITLKSMGELKPGDYAINSDPYVIKEAGIWYLVLGARLEGGKPCISLYKSDNFVDWEYVGIPLVGEGTKHWECAALFKLDDKWVVIYSPQGQCGYYTGTMDFKNCHFEPEYNGFLDHSGETPVMVYAAYVGMPDQLDRRHLWMTSGGGSQCRGSSG
jgi:hypothetical protein